jgi:hypothetical protein
VNNMESLFGAVGHLKLLPEDYVIAGSAPLLVYGIRAEIQDLDVVARDPAWKRLADVCTPVRGPYDNVQIVQTTYCGTPLEILNGWFPRLMGWTVEYLIGQADSIQGINFMPLQLTLDWKRALGRARDLEDIRRIEKFISAEDA